MKHLYGLITLLTLFTGIATLTLGVLSWARSKEKHLKYFLVILAAFNGKFLADLLWGYTVLNISDFPQVLFRIVLTFSCLFDLVYFFFFILLWNSLFALGLTWRFLAVSALGLVVVFAFVLLGGTYDSGSPAYRPGPLAGIANLVAVLIFLWIIFIGFSHFRLLRAKRLRYFLGITLVCLCIGFLQMAGSLFLRLARFPDLELRAPGPEEIGFPWQAVYFAFYMAGIIFLFLKWYLPASGRAADVARPASDPQIGAPGLQGETLDAFCRRYAISTREREVLALVVEGYGNGEIGERLFISTGTVKTHMHSVFKKTGTGTRTRLLRLFLV